MAQVMPVAIGSGLHLRKQAMSKPDRGALDEGKTEIGPSKQGLPCLQSTVFMA